MRAHAMTGQRREMVWGCVLGALVGGGIAGLLRDTLPVQPYDLRGDLPVFAVLVSGLGGGALQLLGIGRATVRWRRAMFARFVGGLLLFALGFAWAQGAVVLARYQGHEVLWLTGLGRPLPSCGCPFNAATCILRAAGDVFTCWGRGQILLATGVLSTSLLLLCACASSAVGVLLMKGLERGRVLEASVEPQTPVLEKVIRQKVPFLDPVTWRQRLTLLERQVCRIELGGRPVGTGFLIGPDLVMTNHHVVESLVRGAVSPSALSCVFDYLREGERAVGAGRPCLLAADWSVDRSPHSPVDVQTDPKPRDPAEDELDHAVLRLAEQVGNEPVQGSARGWMTLAETFPLEGGDPLVILQHPNGRPLEIAIDTEALLGVNPSGNRVRYRTNTEPGSSGSPCFDLQLRHLVALHHSGDPSRVRTAYNEGIPAPCLRRRLMARGIL